MTEELNPAIPYESIISEAHELVVRRALEYTSQNMDGTTVPKPHQLYLGFQTTAVGVVIHETLLKDYPKTMVLVLENQVFNPRVTDFGFYVTLRFKGVPRDFYIPWTSLTMFADTYMNIQFQWVRPDVIVEERPVFDPTPAPIAESDGGKVVNLFDRRKPHA